MKFFKKEYCLLLSIFFIACNGGFTPASVAKKFLKAFEEKKYEEAKKYCTPETVRLVEIAESLSKVPNAKMEFAQKKYEVLSQEIKGEEAIVKFKEKGAQDIENLTLKRINGKWFVAITKEDIMGKQLPRE